MDFTFKLTEQEANFILNALMKEPYIAVAGLIQKLDQQAFEQRQNAEILKAAQMDDDCVNERTLNL